MRLGVIALVLAVAFGFWELRILRSIPMPGEIGRPNGDLYAIYYPLYSFAYRGPEFLPTWNPYQLAGTPCLGEYAGGLLYPPNMLGAVAPVHRALGWLVMLHLMLAGVATLAVARAASLSFAAAVLAAVGFMLNAFLIGEHLRPMYLNGLAWIPVVALLAGRLVVSPSARNAVWLGVAVALQFLTGHAQIVCYEAWALVLVAVPTYLVVARRWQPRYLGGLAATAALAAGIAALLAAAQLLPLIEVVRIADRNLGGMTVEQTRPQQPTWDFIATTAAASGMVVLLAPFALLASGRSRGLVWVCTLLVVFTTAIGVGSPLYALFFYRLPGVDLFRLPHEILLIGALALSVLAGIGLDAVHARLSWPRFAIGMVVAAIVAAVLRPAFGVVWPAAVLLGLVALALASAGPWGRAVSWAVVAVVVVERFAHPGNAVVIPAANEDAFFAESPFVEVLRKRIGHDRILTIKNWQNRFPIMEKAGSLWRLPVVQDYEALTPVAYHDFLEPLEVMNVDRPGFSGRYVAPPNGSGWRPLDLLSTRFVVVAPGAGPWIPANGDRFRSIYQGADAKIYENTQALPRAYLATTPRVVPDRAEVLTTLMSPDFDPRAEVLLEEPIPETHASEAADVPAEVTIGRVEPARVGIAASTPRPAVLVLTDLHWPGWRVTVDGVPRPMLRANYLLRGVALDPGRHTVVFSYASAPARIGTAITVLTVLGLLGWLALARRRARSHKVESRTPFA